MANGLIRPPGQTARIGIDPAFPFIIPEPNGLTIMPGFSRYEYAALQIMTALISSDPEDQMPLKEAATLACNGADALFDEIKSRAEDQKDG